MNANYITFSWSPNKQKPVVGPPGDHHMGSSPVSTTAMAKTRPWSALGKCISIETWPFFPIFGKVKEVRFCCLCPKSLTCIEVAWSCIVFWVWRQTVASIPTVLIGTISSDRFHEPANTLWLAGRLNKKLWKWCMSSQQTRGLWKLHPWTT